MNVEEEAGFQKMVEEESAAEVKWVVDCNHLMVYIIITSTICVSYSMCMIQLGGRRVLNQGIIPHIHHGLWCFTSVNM